MVIDSTEIAQWWQLHNLNKQKKSDFYIIKGCYDVNCISEKAVIKENKLRQPKKLKRPNTTIKKYRLSEWLKKHDPPKMDRRPKQTLLQRRYTDWQQRLF